MFHVSCLNYPKTLYPNRAQGTKAEHKHHCHCPCTWPWDLRKLQSLPLESLRDPIPQEQTQNNPSKHLWAGTSSVSVVSSIQVNDLSIERSEVELKEDSAIHISIRNVTALFKGTLTYGYAGAWL